MRNDKFCVLVIVLANTTNMAGLKVCIGVFVWKLISADRIKPVQSDFLRDRNKHVPDIGREIMTTNLCD